MSDIPIFRIRPLGILDGQPSNEAELHDECVRTRKFLLEFGNGWIGKDYLFHDANQDGLLEAIAQGRVLGLEQWTGSDYRLDGTIAYDSLDLIDQRFGKSDQHLFHAAMLRALACRKSAGCDEGLRDPRRLKARLLIREAQLRSTARSRYRTIQSMGVFGVIDEANGRALNWIQREGVGETIVISPDSAEAESDQTIKALSRYLFDKGRAIDRLDPFKVVILNRTGLREAAFLHRAGCEQLVLALPEGPVKLVTEPADPARGELDLLVAGLAVEHVHPNTNLRYGLKGDKFATVWGPDPSPDMTAVLGMPWSGEGPALASQ